MEYLHLEKLSHKIPHRGSTTDYEKKASEYISSVFRGNNIEVTIQEFLSVKSFSLTYSIIYSLSVIGVLIFFIFKIALGIIFCIISLILFITEVSTYGILGKLLKKSKSQNIIGRIYSKEENKKRIVIIAHYDSSKSGLMFHPRLVKGFRTSFLLTFFSLVFNPIFCSLSIIFHQFIIISLIPSFILLCALFLLIHRECFGKYIPGANDNASGVAVLLELAKYFSKLQPKNIEIWFVATGCEEVGLVGILEFIKKYKNEIKDAYIINLDNIGEGNLKYLIGEGMLNTFRIKKELIKLIENVNSKHKFYLKPCIFKTMLTDATCLLIRRYNAFTLMALDENNTIPNWHWQTDTIDNINLDNLNKVYNFVKELIWEIQTYIPYRVSKKPPCNANCKLKNTK